MNATDLFEKTQRDRTLPVSSEFFWMAIFTQGFFVDAKRLQL
jgi:hypothetical protein